MSEHTNTQGERISIERRMMNGVTPVDVLVIHDDPPPVGSGVKAPMLLDEGTRNWLRMELVRLDREAHGE